VTRSADGNVDATLSTVPRLMTAQEVAELLRVPRSTVYELARNRRIPFVKVGRRTLFVQQALLEWIAAQTVRPRG
jgi:excisionase family DNA binding protein